MSLVALAAMSTSERRIAINQLASTRVSSKEREMASRTFW